MRDHLNRILVCAGVAAALTGCNGSGGTSSSGFFQVVFSDEQLETVAGNRCAVRGNATNGGNLTARVELTYEARNASGAVIGTSTASFQVASFSNFDFKNSKTNSAGQPSSTTFDNGLACSGISDFKRVRTVVDRA